MVALLVWLRRRAYTWLFGPLPFPEAVMKKAAASPTSTTIKATHAHPTPHTQPPPPHAARGTRSLSDKSYTTSSTSRTLYLTPSLRLRSASFFRLSSWKPACTSFTKLAMRRGRA